MTRTSIEVCVRKDRQSAESVTLSLLLDSGRPFAVVAAPVLRHLGVEPDGIQTFQFRNGEIATRRAGEAYFEFQGNSAAARVVFGEAEDCNIMGTVTLGFLELVLDPLTRDLKPLPMLLMTSGIQSV